jgi:hypothetical protein
VWTADHLAHHGWSNCGLYQLCKREPEIAAHLMFMCRYSQRIWQGLKDGLGLVNLDIAQWSSFGTVEAWWCAMTEVYDRRRKGLSLLGDME